MVNRTGVRRGILFATCIFMACGILSIFFPTVGTVSSLAIGTVLLVTAGKW